MALGKLSTLILAACAVTTLWADDDKPRRRVRLGAVTVGAGYGYGGYYPGFRGFYAPFGGFYSPWYDPFLMSWMHPGYYSGFGWGPSMGEVKLKAVPTDAGVFLDGAYAGEAGKLKSMWLDPGVYNLEVKSDQ